MDTQPGQTIQPDHPAVPRKVLCIEDEHFIGELYQRALTNAGYEMTLEIDGARGLQLPKPINLTLFC